MTNLLESLQNAIAFLFAMRLVILIAMVGAAFWLTYNYFQSSSAKRFGNQKKR